MNASEKLVKEYNLTSHNEAKVYIKKGILYIAISNKTLMIQLPYVTGSKGEGSMDQ